MDKFVDEIGGHFQNHVLSYSFRVGYFEKNCLRAQECDLLLESPF